MIEARRAWARSMTEDQLQDAILDAARLFGWRAYHIRRSDRAIVQGDAGFPDVTLARDGRVLFLELKREGGRMTRAQVEWIEAIGVGALIVRPDDLDTILGMLR
jgi:hypothetical protein